MSMSTNCVDFNHLQTAMPTFQVDVVLGLDGQNKAIWREHGYSKINEEIIIIRCKY